MLLPNLIVHQDPTTEIVQPKPGMANVLAVQHDARDNEIVQSPAIVDGSQGSRVIFLWWKSREDLASLPKHSRFEEAAVIELLSSSPVVKSTGSAGHRQPRLRADVDIAAVGRGIVDHAIGKEAATAAIWSSNSSI